MLMFIRNSQSIVPSQFNMWLEEKNFQLESDRLSSVPCNLPVFSVWEQHPRVDRFQFGEIFTANGRGSGLAFHQLSLFQEVMQICCEGIWSIWLPDPWEESPLMAVIVSEPYTNGTIAVALYASMTFVLIVGQVSQEKQSCEERHCYFIWGWGEGWFWAWYRAWEKDLGVEFFCCWNDSISRNALSIFFKGIFWEIWQKNESRSTQCYI